MKLIKLNSLVSQLIINWRGNNILLMYQVKTPVELVGLSSQYLNKQGLISLYYAFICPYLTYYNHMWGSNYKTNLKRLIMLQNKTVRIIAHACWKTSCDLIYKNLNIMKLSHINTYLIGRFMFGMSIGKVSEYLTSLFKKNSDFHSYITRVANLYHVPPVKSNWNK